MRYNLACYACQLGNLKEPWDWLKKAMELANTKEVKLMVLEDPDLESLWKEIEEILRGMDPSAPQWGFRYYPQALVSKLTMPAEAWSCPRIPPPLVLAMPGSDFSFSASVANAGPSTCPRGCQVRRESSAAKPETFRS